MNKDELRRLLTVVLPAATVVAAVAVIVAVFLSPESANDSFSRGSPRIGRDHWHAVYQVFVCGEQQANFPTWESGVHTHGDGVIHIHPFVPSEEGEGARLVKWFEYGGGRLTQSEMRIPGSRRTYKNGDECDDGGEAVLQVFVNGERLDDWRDYIPQDGDRVRIVFGRPEEGAVPPPEIVPQEMPTPPRR